MDASEFKEYISEMPFLDARRKHLRDALHQDGGFTNPPKALMPLARTCSRASSRRLDP
jgi:hypothetical protein